MNPFHEQFVTEARDLVQQATNDLIAMEREGFAAERIDRIFRAFHTLKGSAGVVELPAMALMLHAAEDLLAAIHAGRLHMTAAITDQALGCLDQVSLWVNDFEAQGSLPLDAGEMAREMSAQLRALLSTDLPKGAKADRGGSASGGGTAPPDWVSRLIESCRAQISLRLERGDAHLFAFSYEPSAGCFFHGDDPLGLIRQVTSLLAFHVEARQAWPPIGELDPYACNLRLLGIVAGTRAELSNIFRLVPEQVTIVDVPSAALRGEHRLGMDDDDATELIRTVIAEQRQILRGAVRGDDFIGRVGAAARVAANALRIELGPDMAERVERAKTIAISQGDVALLLAVVDEGLELVTAILRDGNREFSGTAELPGPKIGETEPSTTRWLRVSESRIDRLVDLAGELIIAKNGFAHLAKRLEAEVGGEVLTRAVRREYDALERLAGEMHAAIMLLRMVAIAQVFRSFPRLVRDMSQRLGKKIELITRGETAESDKTIVDRLYEPLLHLVRNAIDHGIESSEQRLAAGKVAKSTLTLQASREGGRFIVEVIDDGRGIDPTVIRRKAAERGLLTGDELAALSDQQAIDLVFTAGFSTAAEISDISGRGVGMDVVRTTIEQLGGRVSLTSRVGVGTTVRLDLPISIAISRIMVVETAGQLFGIPMEAVTETVHLPPDRVSQFKSNDGFVWRDQVVPMCSLASLMNLPGTGAALSEARLAMVTEMSGRVAALEVDAVRDQLEVVLKPMQGVLAKTRGFLGTTLLGDGRILLVLDLREILP
jgi:two-component system, chemotaxis family, sensor kinase CheA